jgi:DNA-binding CsgD family transcriptional regulator
MTITDEASLKADHERFWLSFQAMGSGLWDYEFESDTLFCNARWYEILALDPVATPVNSIADFRHHIHPDDVDAATEIDFDKIEGLIASDERYHAEFRIVRPCGEIRWLRSVACVIRDSTTDRPRAVGCVTDITEFRTGKSTTEMQVGSERRSPDASTPHAIENQDPIEPHAQTLSERERECLLWVSVGKTAWETAVILGLSRRTIEFHLKNAVRKLGASNKVHATTTAIRNGLL